MNVRKSVFIALPLFAAMAMPAPVLAVTGYLYTTVVGVVTNSDPLPAPATTGIMYGGCMAYLAAPVNTASNSPNCPSNWVAFSCDGTYTSKDTAQMLFDQAQLGWATQKTVGVQVDDTKLHNGVCLATHLDLWH